MEMLEISKYAFAALLIGAGIMHFIQAKFFLKIVPKYLPAPKTLVLLSGISEIICGILLVIPQTQNLGSYLTIALLIAVFPANIEMARLYYVKKKKGLWITLLRLPLQILLIWWAYKFIE